MIVPHPDGVKLLRPRQSRPENKAEQHGRSEGRVYARPPVLARALEEHAVVRTTAEHLQPKRGAHPAPDATSCPCARVPEREGERDEVGASIKVRRVHERDLQDSRRIHEEHELARRAHEEERRGIGAGRVVVQMRGDCGPGNTWR